MPSFAYDAASNVGSPVTHIVRVIRFLQQNYPQFWLRRGGADHAVWAPGDRAMCMDDLPEELRSLTWLVHFGQLGSLRPELQPCLSMTDAVVMPSIIDNSRIVAEETYSHPEDSVRMRSTFFFFAGTVLMEDDAQRADPLGYPWTRDHYSQGVRQRVWATYQNKSGYSITDGYLENMPESMRNSRFCLAPTGYGWGNRIIWAMLTGCVPVIISDGVMQPFEDVLPYDEFSVRVAEADIVRVTPARDALRLYLL